MIVIVVVSHCQRLCCYCCHCCLVVIIFLIVTVVALVGGGAAYGGNRPGHGFGHVGGGLEYRVTNNIGLFSDARYVYSSVDPQNAVAVRAGFRFAF